MDLRCTTDNYEQLYARWLVNPGRLLDVADYQPGMKVLDLCGGTGAVSLECVRRGADPDTLTLLDLNPRCQDMRIHQLQGDANHLGDVFGEAQPDCHGRYDRIVIRQAAAYLDWHVFMVMWLRGLLAKDGVLVFNTFRRPRWSLQTYKFNGRRYFEASWYFGRTVYHVQASPGLGWDMTKFRWFSEEDMRRRLDRFFNVAVLTNDKTQTWLCTRRER